MHFVALPPDELLLEDVPAVQAGQEVAGALHVSVIRHDLHSSLRPAQTEAQLALLPPHALALLHTSVQLVVPPPLGPPLPLLLL